MIYEFKISVGAETLDEAARTVQMVARNILRGQHSARGQKPSSRFDYTRAGSQGQAHKMHGALYGPKTLEEWETFAELRGLQNIRELGERLKAPDQGYFRDAVLGIETRVSAAGEALSNNSNPVACLAMLLDVLGVVSELPTLLEDPAVQNPGMPTPEDPLATPGAEPESILGDTPLVPHGEVADTSRPTEEEEEDEEEDEEEEDEKEDNV